MQRCPPLLAPGASNNKTQLQQRIDMILNTKRNTSPRLAARWVACMASAAALLALVAICSAPRIVLAQSDPAPAPENPQDPPIADPRAPAGAPATASVSPVASATVSGQTAPPAT